MTKPVPARGGCHGHPVGSTWGRATHATGCWTASHRCEAQRGSPVNVIAVDRTTIGDARGSVDTLDAQQVAHRPADESAVGHA